MTACTAPLAPAELRDRRAWLLWRFEQRPGDKLAKVPVDPNTGSRTNPYESANWRTLEDAAAHLDAFDGIGIALENGLAGIDLDDCRDPATGVIAPWALDIIERLDSYTELSPSGTGVHVLCLAELPDDLDGHTKSMPEGGEFEVYWEERGVCKRYFTFTGQHLEGTPRTVEQRTTELTALHRELFDGASSSQKPKPPMATTDLPDDALLHTALNARNGERFARLWHGDTSDYPSSSEADEALCCHLTFWCGPDPTRIEELFAQSALGNREKWRDRADYRERTIAKAIARVSATYSGRLPTMPGMVRIDDRLGRLPDGPRMAACFRAMGVDDDEVVAEACGVTPDTARDWWRAVLDADLEHAARDRPTCRFSIVPEALICDTGLTVNARVTALAILKTAKCGVARVGVEALAKRRRYDRKTISRHTAALERAGHVIVVRSTFNVGEKRRDHCNIYTVPDVVEAWQEVAEARGSFSAGEMSPVTDGGASPHDNGAGRVLAAVGRPEAPVAGAEATRGREMSPVGGAQMSRILRESQGGGSTPAGRRRSVTSSTPPPPHAKPHPAPKGAELPLSLPSTPAMSERQHIDDLQWRVRSHGRPKPHPVDVAAALKLADGDVQVAEQILLEDGRAEPADDLHFEIGMGFVIPSRGPIMKITDIDDARGAIDFDDAVQIAASNGLNALREAACLGVVS